MFFLSNIPYRQIQQSSDAYFDQRQHAERCAAVVPAATLHYDLYTVSAPCPVEGTVEYHLQLHTNTHTCTHTYIHTDTDIHQDNSRAIVFALN